MHLACLRWLAYRPNPLKNMCTPLANTSALIKRLSLGTDIFAPSMNVRIDRQVLQIP